MPLKAANIIKCILAKTDTVTVEIASNIGIIVSDSRYDGSNLNEDFMTVFMEKQ